MGWWVLFVTILVYLVLGARLSMYFGWIVCFLIGTLGIAVLLNGLFVMLALNFVF